MAKITLEVIGVLRETAIQIRDSTSYQWGHMGLCNCGFLAQQITKLKKEEIHARAMQRYGDWNEQLNDYCPTSGLPMDELISEMLAFGFDADDFKHLERLSDKRILQRLPPDQRNLRHNVKDDVIKYLNAWSEMVEEKLLEKIELPQFEITALRGRTLAY